MNKHKSSIACVLLAVLIVVLSFPAAHANELDYSDIEQLNKWQYCFCRTIMSIALKDSYDTYQETGYHIYPSITCGQACFEGGICGAPISVIGNGHFAVRAYSYFKGMVYDDHEQKLYASYADAINIKGQKYVDNTGFWRAYESWDECVRDHTVMLLSQPKYQKFIEAKDYKHAAQAYQDSKYMGEKANYKNNLLKRVEGYGFVQLDNVQEDENGVFGLIMDSSKVSLHSGETITLHASSYPVEIDNNIQWQSMDPDVAIVSQDGTVTAVAHGYTLITAIYNGKEACCVVCVDCNAYNMKGTHSIYDEEGKTIGKIVKGQPLYVESEITMNNVQYYRVTARVSNNSVVSGFIQKEHIYVEQPALVSVRTNADFLTFDVGQIKQMNIIESNVQFSQYEWQSLNTDIIAVSESGYATALQNGATVLNLYADGHLALTVPVMVGPDTFTRVYAAKSNDLRAKPVKDKTKNEYGTVRVGEEAILLSQDDDWYRILVYAEGFYYDGYARPDNFAFEPSAQVSSMTIPSVLIVGDITGDGLLSNEDTALLRKHLLQANELDETAVKAADTNGDGEITTLDYIILKRIVVNKQITE